VTHREAWARLPDLLDDRDDPAVLAHVQVCAVCQRQLFLLGRVDRLLRERTPTLSTERTRASRLRSPHLLVAAAALVVALWGLLTIVASQAGPTHALTFRTGSGEAVGQALMGHSDAHNVSVALSARHLPIRGGHVFVLWAAGGDARSSMQVGRFMVDRSGGCRVRFNLPADQRWARFWITRPGASGAIVART
jgi:hypothetical protein